MPSTQVDLLSEQLLSLSELRAMIPSNRPGGKRVDKSTLCRWITHGCRGIRLEAERIGGSFYTSREAFARFRARLNQRRLTFTPGDPITTTTGVSTTATTSQSDRQIGHAAAMAKLAAAGI